MEIDRTGIDKTGSDSDLDTLSTLKQKIAEIKQQSMDSGKELENLIQYHREKMIDAEKALEEVRKPFNQSIKDIQEKINFLTKKIEIIRRTMVYKKNLERYRSGRLEDIFSRNDGGKFYIAEDSAGCADYSNIPKDSKIIDFSTLIEIAYSNMPKNTIYKLLTDIIDRFLDNFKSFIEINKIEAL
jgi:hypothetical protein